MLYCVNLQFNCASSVASQFYFWSHLGSLLDVESSSDNVVSQSVAPTVSRADQLSGSGVESEQGISVDLTLIVLWQVDNVSFPITFLSYD